MKKIFAFILLVCHMNTSMFLPQVAEDDQFDTHGIQIDDINSVSEYIDQIVLGHVDKTPEDEDNDNGQNFHVVKVADYHFTQQYVAIAQLPFTEIKKHEFSEYRITSIPSPSFDILTPPPEVLLFSWTV